MKDVVIIACTLAVVMPILTLVLRRIFRKTIVGTLLIPLIFMVLCIACLSMVAGWQRSAARSFWVMPVNIGLVLTYIFILMRMIVKPLRKVAEVAGILERGEGDLTVRLNYSKNDEIGEISRRINGFLDHITALTSTISEQTAVTDKNSAGLMLSMEQIEKDAGEIETTATTINDTISRQLALVEQASGRTSEQKAIVERQNGRISDQSAAVNRSSSAIEEMVANINTIAGNLAKNAAEFDNLNEDVKTGQESVSRLKEAVRVLHEQSTGVFDANKIIQTIASQTNLLAMNAAIEAAHAGEAGKGFSVVADEIRKLAENSSSQSKIISENIKKLLESMELAVKGVDETGAAFASISGSVETVNNMEASIKNAMQEQSTGSSQILDSLTSIREITTEIMSGSQTILEGSISVQEGMEGLRAISETVKTSSQGIASKTAQTRDEIVKSKEALTENFEAVEKVSELSLSLLKKA